MRYESQIAGGEGWPHNFGTNTQNMHLLFIDGFPKHMLVHYDLKVLSPDDTETDSPNNTNLLKRILTQNITLNMQ